MEYRKFNKTTISISILLISLFSIILIQSAAAELDINSKLIPGEYYYDKFSYSNVTKGDREKSNSKLLINLESNDDIFEFDSNDTITILLINETEMIQWLQGVRDITPKKNWTQRDHRMVMSYETLIGYGFETEIEWDEGKSRNVSIVDVYVIIYNAEPNGVQYFLRYQYENQLHFIIDEIFRYAIFCTFFGIGIKLLYDAKKVNGENKQLADIYTNYGIGLFIAGLATFAWKVYHLYRELNPQDQWIQSMIFENMPENLQLSGNYLTWVTFSSIGLSCIFMSNTVEKQVQNRKYAYMTMSLLIMQIVLIIGIFFPDYLIYIFFIWVAVLIIAVVNIMITYLRLAIKTPGMVRKKSTLILLGLIIAFLTVGLRDFIRPEYLANGAGVIGMLILYKGIKLDISKE